jgi:hypothetical protein
MYRYALVFTAIGKGCAVTLRHQVALALICQLMKLTDSGLSPISANILLAHLLE